tara:strand:- start:386 stop:598 length:213 start_codon:yes stop_codon:yes gene_type:complete
MKHLKHSKWTAVKKIKDWRHYEVLNINKKKQKVEMFSVCAKKIKIEVSFKDLKDDAKWLSGWIEIVNEST